MFVPPWPVWYGEWAVPITPGPRTPWPNARMARWGLLTQAIDLQPRGNRQHGPHPLTGFLHFIIDTLRGSGDITPVQASGIRAVLDAQGWASALPAVLGILSPALRTLLTHSTTSYRWVVHATTVTESEDASGHSVSPGPHIIGHFLMGVLANGLAEDDAVLIVPESKHWHGLRTSWSIVAEKDAIMNACRYAANVFRDFHRLLYHRRTALHIVAPPRPLRRSTARSGSLPLFSYATLSLPGHARTRGFAASPSTTSAHGLHLVRAHPKRYLRRPLLGQHYGVFMWSAHVAGRAVRVHAKDYRLR
jgi:hypothetical protein